MYQDFLKKIFMKLLENPSIPDLHLMIGVSEERQPLPVLIYKNLETIQTNPIIQSNKDLSHDKIVVPLNGFEYSVDDFPTNSMYLGNGGF